MFKLVVHLPDGPLKSVLKKTHLYHPSLEYLQGLSEGPSHSLAGRSKEFSGMLSDILINGVWKKTAAERLTVLDQWVMPFIQKPASGPLTILDVGGSDGSTSHDMLRYFQENSGVPVKVTVLELEFRLLSFKKGWLRYYLTHDQKPFLLQLGFLGILFEETKAKEGFLFNPLVRVLKKFLTKQGLEKHMTQGRDILLQNPVAQNDPQMTWLEADLFQFHSSLAASFDLIRCCNVLNLGYFGEKRLAEALRVLAGYLKPDGLLLVSRTLDHASGRIHPASLCRKTATGFEFIAELNGGSEIRHVLFREKK